MVDLPADRIDLDITALACPMTFVRVRLLLDRLEPGASAVVRLAGEEPRANIPRQLTRLGHAVLALVPEPDGAAFRLSFRKQG